MAEDTVAMLTRRLVTLGALALPLGACATVPPSPSAPSGRLTLVDAFRGRTVGEGVFRVPVAGIERRFRATLNGRYDGRVLTVVEDFLFADGETDRLTWRFTRVAPGRWTGTREDVVGQADVREGPTEIRLDYTADARSRGTTTRLGFSDIIYRRADGVVVNEAVVTRFGVPIGSVEFLIRRG
jgi:hypothetical protein